MSFDSLKFSTSSNLDQVEKFSEWILDFYTFESSRRKHSQLHFCECACVRLSRSYSRVIRTISVCHEITIAQCHIIATSHVCVCVCSNGSIIFDEISCYWVPSQASSHAAESSAKCHYYSMYIAVCVLCVQCAINMGML